MVSSLKLCTVYTFIFAWSAEWEICHPRRESQEARAGRETDKRKTEKEIQSMTAGMGNKAEGEGEHEWNLSVKTSPEWIRTWRQTVPLSALQNNKHSIPWLVCTQVSSALRAQTLHKTNMSRERCRLQRPTRTEKKTTIQNPSWSQRAGPDHRQECAFRGKESAYWSLQQWHVLQVTHQAILPPRL